MFGDLIEIYEKKTAIIHITKNGERLAKTLLKIFPNSEIFSISKERKLDSIFEECFKNFNNIIAIMATGIVVRKVAKLIKSKITDPALIVMDDNGKFAISLISGHLGGGNELASYISERIGAIPVITTATDVNKKFAIDDMVRKFGWSIENPYKIKVINRAVLNNEKVAINIPAEVLKKFYHDDKNILKCLKFYKSLNSLIRSRIEHKIAVTNLLDISSDFLIVRPKNLYIGIGCNRGTSFEELDAVIKHNLLMLKRSFKSINSIASIDIKSDEKCLLMFREKYNINLRFFTKEELNSVKDPYKQSRYVEKTVGVKGVCEPAAILSAKRDMRECFKRKKLLPKIKQGNVTIAVQELLFS